jgi:hypothetical protein
LIIIPYWWDRQKDSIIATIHQHRPDLIPNPGMAFHLTRVLTMIGNGQPIPAEPPVKTKIQKRPVDNMTSIVAFGVLMGLL